MDGYYSDWWVHKIEDAIGGTAAQLTTPRAGLLLQMPLPDGTGLSEVTGAGYVRQAITFGAAANRRKAISADLVFGPPSADWGTVVGFACFEGATNNWAFAVRFKSATELAPRLVQNGDGVFTIPASAFEMVIRAGGATANVVADAGNSTTALKTDLLETTADYWKDHAFIMRTGAQAGRVALINAYNGTTKIITLATALPGIPAAGDDFEIVRAA